MSYDVRLVGADGETVQLPAKHDLRGGTYAVGGTRDAWVNITYNYGQLIREAFGNPEAKESVRQLYGMTAAGSIPFLEAALQRLPVEPPSRDYWEPTPGNVRAALSDLLTLARRVPPESVWSGD